jgi:hypothetical protein
MTDVSAWSENAIPFMCDFDGTNAVFSDGAGIYLYAISGEVATQIGPASGGGATTSVTIAERAGTGGAPAGGVLLAYAALDDPNVGVQYAAPPVSPATNWSGVSASLGDPNNIYGQPIAFQGGIAKFYRTIYGTSTVLGAAGVTQVAGGGAQECIVTLFDVKVSGGSITATRQGARAPVLLPNTIAPNNTLAVTVFSTFPWWWPWRFPLPRPLARLLGTR